MYELQACGDRYIGSVPVYELNNLRGRTQRVSDHNLSTIPVNESIKSAPLTSFLGLHLINGIRFTSSWTVDNKNHGI